jgi:hypothetical protein
MAKCYTACASAEQQCVKKCGPGEESEVEIEQEEEEVVVMDKVIEEEEAEELEEMQSNPSNVDPACVKSCGDTEGVCAHSCPTQCTGSSDPLCTAKCYVTCAQNLTACMKVRRKQKKEIYITMSRI